MKVDTTYGEYRRTRRAGGLSIACACRPRRRRVAAALGLAGRRTARPPPAPAALAARARSRAPKYGSPPSPHDMWAKPPMPPRSSGERSDRHQAIMLMNEEELHSKFPETGVRPLPCLRRNPSRTTVAPPLSDRIDGFQQRHARKGPREEGAQGGPAHLHLWRQERCESNAGPASPRPRAVAYKAPPPPPTQESSTCSTSGTGPARSCPRRTHKCHAITRARSPAGRPSHAVRPSLKVLMRKLQTIESGKAFGQPMQVTVSDEEKDRLYSMVREAQLRDIQPLAVTTGKKKRKVVEVTESD